MQTSDIAIIGGGIVGLSTAYHLSASANCKLVLLEKEPQIGTHQTGKNSGVIHSGVYYKPGSQKAQFCVQGRQMLYEFCDRHHIPYRLCGKLIVANSQSEEATLQTLFNHGTQNGLAGLKIVDKRGIQQVEPAVSGTSALVVPEAGIINFRDVAQTLADTVVRNGGQVLTHGRLLKVETIQGGGTRLHTTAGVMETGGLINCAGLQSDRVARLCGVQTRTRIIPFRGEYYALSSDLSNLVNGLVYPVPDPELPFLGVHLTKKLDGKIEVGPNALFSMGREKQGFGRHTFGDASASLGFPGFWRLARNHWKHGVREIYRSCYKGAFVKELKKLFPPVEAGNLTKSHFGVRAQAVSQTGELIQDFVVEKSDHQVHVINAPSPAATSALAIGKHIAAMV